MYGIQCDRCRAFTKIENAEGWGRVQRISTSKGYIDPEGDTRYLCPICLDLVEGDFIE